jgi:hypothetical protein
MFPERENGLRVEVSEDASRVVLTLDRAHAAQLARTISHVSANRGGDGSWAALATEAGSGTWLGTILRLIACSENLQPVHEDGQRGGGG